MPNSRKHKIVGNPGITHSVTMQCNGMGHTLVTTDDYKINLQMLLPRTAANVFCPGYIFVGIGMLACINGTNCMFM